jgi:putative Ca2+/H+ antiporter (TMEM165/GDT1 family)
MRYSKLATLICLALCAVPFFYLPWYYALPSAFGVFIVTAGLRALLPEARETKKFANLPPEVIQKIKRERDQQFVIARNWVVLLSVVAAIGVGLGLIAQLHLVFFVAAVLAIVAGVLIGRILAFCVGIVLGRRAARKLKNDLIRASQAGLASVASKGLEDTPMPKFIIPQGGRFVEVIAPDEATARAIADKLDVAIDSPIDNPNLTVCPDCHHMVSKDAENCPSCGRKLKTTSTERSAELRDAESITSTWWYVSNNQRKGPIEDEELRRLLVDGTLNSNSLVWKQGMEEWQPARQVGELTSVLSSLPPEIPT